MLQINWTRQTLEKRRDLSDISEGPKYTLFVIRGRKRRANSESEPAAKGRGPEKISFCALKDSLAAASLLLSIRHSNDDLMAKSC
jgi:hypothetical protein